MHTAIFWVAEKLGFTAFNNSYGHGSFDILFSFATFYIHASKHMTDKQADKWTYIRTNNHTLAFTHIENMHTYVHIRT